MPDKNPVDGKRTAAWTGLGIFKGFGLVVVLFAIAVGTVAKVRPALFLRIPRVGFIPWAMTGGIMPPYIWPTVFAGDNHKSWLKDNDVVVSTGAKSGTTWMLFCTHQIRVKGQAGPKPFVDVSVTTPWPELLQHPDHSPMEQVEMMHNFTLPDGSNLAEYWNNKEYPFRIFKSHYAPRQQGKKPAMQGAKLPVRERPNVKYVAMVRNGLEVVKSFNPFVNKHREEFRTMWGGFPPPAPEDDITESFNNWMPGGLFGFIWWEYVSGWWTFRNDPNVLLLHYSDMITDPRTGIKKLAAFMGVTLTPSEFEDVAVKCSKEYMAAHESNFRYTLPLHPTFGNNGEHGLMDLGGMVSKRLMTGNSGNLKYSDEQKAQWAKMEEELFQDPVLVKWAREGGSSPGTFA
mmetsp:Transcript_53034/g.125513  ORF Transcript_53034/g.125513 Transcript_53034/m.125513 type:complete len:401 (+) Transcript_53034:162-1364(+)|eukprot:CAMPEP_0180134048 /NCGR_PEP_ID=MMETSP0986-20121125/9913_1 /TAXON_ID=697907 /ORGANISM="non described non described, Strain CCMP2293" /LENGTH=400 /DNA_ID=CAMNT_0022074301 /DNA_START=204 /DNA_END=1406 /DNA_ORIENTATION=-